MPKFFCEAFPSRLRPKASLLALGTDTRQRVAWSRGGVIRTLWPAQDFSCAEDFFSAAASFLARRRAWRPRVLAFDPHPLFAVGRSAAALRKKFFPKAALVPVFHHAAHAAFFGHLRGRRKKFIAVTFDGTGYGPDGLVWGGEFFFYDGARLCRMAHLADQVLPGGDAAIREPWRMALSILHKAYGDRATRQGLAFLKEIPAGKVAVVRQAIVRRFNAPLTSSVGRLFDAAAALLGLKAVVSREAEAAIALERAASSFRGRAGSYGFRVKEEEGMLVADPLEAFVGMVDDLRSRRPVAQIAFSFHQTVGDIVVEVCRQLAAAHGVRDVFLSGGVFMNGILTRQVREGLSQKKLRSLFCPGSWTTDAGIAPGQIAACIMENICA